jgi:hypothetical protein
MTSKAYTTGIIVSAALAISGVLWHQTRSPYVAGEDIAAVLADTLTVREIVSNTGTNTVGLLSLRYYWTDYGGAGGTWNVDPETMSTTSFTVTTFRASENLRYAAIALNEAVKGVWTDVVGGRYFLDPRTLDGAAGQLDLSVSISWGTNSPYRLEPFGVGPTNIVFNRNLIDIDVNAVALQDRIVTGTNRYGYSWPPGSGTPLVSASIFGGSQNYDALTNRLLGAESWWAYAGISPVSYLLQPVEVIRPNVGQEVTLSQSWEDRNAYDASTYPDKASEYRWHDEFLGVSITPFISKAGLDVFRRVLTNMTRTVEFNPACSVVATSYAYSGTNAMVTSTSSISATLPITFFDYKNTVGAYTNINWFTDPGGTNSSGYTTNGWQTDSWYLSASWADLAITPTSIASNYYTSGMVDRIRCYAVTEASTPGAWFPYELFGYTFYKFAALSNLHAYVGASLSVNQTETYGYPITHCSMPDILFPTSSPPTPADWSLLCGSRTYEAITPGYFSTNQVWNLIGDVSHPSTPPTFTLASLSHDKADLKPPAQMLDATGTYLNTLADPFDTHEYYDISLSWTRHTMRLSKLMLVIDWSITLKSSGGYTNAP